MRPMVYLTQPVAESAIARLREATELSLNPDALHIATKAELIAAVRSSDILFCLLHDVVDRDVIAANPGLKAIASMTITPADIDVAEATRRRIPVTVIPALLLNDATADLAWALVMAAARRLAEGDRQGAWYRRHGRRGQGDGPPRHGIRHARALLRSDSAAEQRREGTEHRMGAARDTP